VLRIAVTALIASMDHNPYKPPQAETELSPLREVSPRPIAVWILIVLLLAVVLVFVVGLTLFIWAATVRRGEVRSPHLLTASLVWRLALAAVFFAAAYSVYRRQRWSRWFGVALIFVLALVFMFRPDTAYYASDAERAGGYLARFIVVPLFLAWWAYAFAFSSKARRYFSKQAD
jgi:hypothetical protein